MKYQRHWLAKQGVTCPGYWTSCELLNEIQHDKFWEHILDHHVPSKYDSQRLASTSNTEGIMNKHTRLKYLQDLPINDGRRINSELFKYFSN